MGPVVDDALFRRPDGTPLPAVPALDPGPLPLAAIADHPHHEPESLTPPWWYGEPLRLAYVVSAVLSARTTTAAEGAAA